MRASGTTGTDEPIDLARTQSLHIHAFQCEPAAQSRHQPHLLASGKRRIALSGEFAGKPSRKRGKRALDANAKRID